MTSPSVPDEHYLWLGRISAAFGMLDVQIGMLGHAVLTRQCWTEDWTAVAGRPGAAVRLCTSAIEHLPADLADRTRALLSALDTPRSERHRLSHSVFVLDPAGTGSSAPWSLKDPKGGEFSLLEEAAGARLVAGLNRLSREAGEIRAELKGRGLCR